MPQLPKNQKLRSEVASLILKFPESTRDVFDAVRDGRKTIETRAATPKYQSVKPGDKLTLVCGQDRLGVTVVRTRHFANVDHLYDEIAVEDVIPSVKTAGEAKKIHYGFPGYREKLQKFGIMAFDIELD